MSRGTWQLTPWTELALAMVLVFAALLWPLHRPSIDLHGEAREALVVRSIVRTGSWVLPRRNGELPSKPPLFHWMAASAAHVVGLSDAVIRLPSALGAAIVTGATFGLGMVIGGRLMAWLATAALLGMLTFWQTASEARVDMIFAAATTVALAGFFVWYRGSESPGWARVASYLAFAGAVLAKGPVGLVLPGLVVLAFVVWERRPGALLRFWSWPLVALVLLIDAGWYVLAYRAGGDEFLATQIMKENVYRFVGHGSFSGSRGRFAFLRMERTLATNLLPWNLALLGAAMRGLRGERADQAARFLHSWWLAILVFFTLSSGKRPVYLVPLMPAVALLAGRAMQRAYANVPADGVVSWLGVRLTLARFATVLAVVDVCAWGGSMLLRQHKSSLRSLGPFAAEVRAVVPADAHLYAAMALPVPQILVLGYKLDRRLERRKLECTGAGDYFLVLETPEGALASSGLKRAPVSLVRDGERCPLPGIQAARERGNP